MQSFSRIFCSPWALYRAIRIILNSSDTMCPWLCSLSPGGSVCFVSINMRAIVWFWFGVILFKILLHSVSKFLESINHVFLQIWKYTSCYFFQIDFAISEPHVYTMCKLSHTSFDFYVFVLFLCFFFSISTFINSCNV